MNGHLVKTLHPPLLPPKAKTAQSRPPMQSGGVLIALSGGAGSTAMLDLVGLREYVGSGERDVTKGEKMAVWSKGWAVHVDFSNVVGHEERGEWLRTLAEERGMGFMLVRAEEAFDPAFTGRLGKMRREAGEEVAESAEAEQGSSVVLSDQSE